MLDCRLDNMKRHQTKETKLYIDLLENLSENRRSALAAAYSRSDHNIQTSFNEATQ